MGIFSSNSIAQLRKNIFYLRAAQKTTARNIAESNTPGAMPLKVEKNSFASHLNLTLPHNGIGFSETPSAFGNFKTSEDLENASEATNGESRISIENESIRLAQIDDEHNLTLKLLSAWKKGVRIVTGNGG